jgi:hypothetical protein
VLFFGLLVERSLEWFSLRVNVPILYIATVDLNVISTMEHSIRLDECDTFRRWCVVVTFSGSLIPTEKIPRPFCVCVICGIYVILSLEK